MNKTELIAAVAAQTDLNKTAAAAALEAIINTIGRQLKKGDSVTLIGFGSFSTSKRAARVVRNPRTGEELRVPARRVPKFTPGKALKEILN